METITTRLIADFPDINFEAGDGFYWSPKSKSVIYKQNSKSKNIAWTLLHEIAHAQLRHKTYSRDIELLNMEVAAWDKAGQLAKKYSIKISEDHIQNCLDSYRNWLHQRSACPSCDTHTLQIDSGHYRCFNCHTKWKVSAARFCRPYRKIEVQKETSPQVKPEVMFL
jgi:hypothetical protein